VQTLHFRDFYNKAVIMLGEKKPNKIALPLTLVPRETCHAAREDDHTSCLRLETEEVRLSVY